MCVFALSGTSHAATMYSVTNLGLPNSPGTYSNPSGFDINSLGQVTGTVHIGTTVFDSTQHPFVWTPNGTGGGTMVDLPAPGGVSNAYGNSINAAGVVAGENRFGGARWTPDGNGGYSYFGFGGGSIERAYFSGVSDAGSIVGAAWVFPSGGWSGFLFTPGGGADLGGGNGTSVEPASINSSGEIAGHATDFKAFVWKPTSPNGTNGTMHSLGVLPLPGHTTSDAHSINDLGQVVGQSQGNSDGNARAFLWTPDAPNGTTGSMIDLGMLAGPTVPITAYDANNNGTVVGTSGFTSLDDSRGFVRTSADGMLDLNALLDGSGAGWIIKDARAVNDAGQITGWGFYDADGPGPGVAVHRAFVLTPVPEPATPVFAITLLTMSFRTRTSRSAARRRF